jgi:YD repeat-containing protein
VRVEKGDAGGATLSTVDTEYAACACSPLGKVKRVSQPYAPGGTVYWTTYTYDALGRTVSVALPGGTGTTTYAYQGNRTTVTDPAAKWKKYTGVRHGC